MLDEKRFEVLMENVQTSVKVIAEGHLALVERLDRIETRLHGIETRVGGLEVFASDAQQRLKRIEGHLELNGSSGSIPRRKATSVAPPKRRKKA